MEGSEIPFSEFTSPNRPDPVPGQIRERNQFRVGQKIKHFFYGEEVGEYKIITLPHPKVNSNDWIIGVETKRNGETFTFDINLAQVGVDHFENDTWNTVQWLVDPEKAEKPKVVSLEERRQARNK